jgi:hypothetical protein
MLANLPCFLVCFASVVGMTPALVGGMNTNQIKATEIKSFYASQIAKCERGIERAHRMIADLPVCEYGDAGWSDRCVASESAVELLLGCRAERAYWARLESEV